MPDKPTWLNPQVSWGNIATIVVFIVTIAVQVGYYQSQMAWQEARISQAILDSDKKVADAVLIADKRAEVLERASEVRESRIRSLEVVSAGTAADIRAMQAGINRIEASLNKLIETRQ